MARTVGSDGERTEAAIRDVAVELFARRGFEAVTMREIAGGVGVQAAAIYRYFPNKEALLFTLLEEHMDLLLKGWRLAAPEGGDPAPALLAFVRNHIDFHLAYRHATHVSNLELRSLSPARLTTILRLRAAYEKELRQILRGGKATGVFAVNDVTLTAMAIIQMLTGVIVWFRPGQRLTVQQVADTYCDMTMRLVGVKGNREESHV